ncbi:dTDP-6-deoxy-L-hexose 3-O-methyltransferase [Falsiroseomonas bella]|uniref:dTDP-6-deoxy-L-hexose 3-O-methyltransferase n=1 Tax=Falsiroseomonas bella TaxID=2184016 RepID=A0A317F8M4_9PROT|nr:TylF/MycF/NovP-related O-methyltransferase [Falsiroseomonas bella]PWS35115.1 dTDP-6-deoxy-L-hexose 3-O-methyltransferase [Falsiroseomonas bella]
MGTYRIDMEADIYEVENTFHLRAPVGRMGKLLAQAELYRRITGLPGAVVECGVYKGASLMRLLAFRRLFETDESRTVIGFDAFGRFPVAEGEADAGFIARFEAAGGPGIARADLEAAIAAKGFSNVALVEGDVFATLPAHLAAHPELRVALLHLDMDVAAPTRFALEQLAPRMVPGGLVLFDDYGVVAGATAVADAFAAARGLRLQKLPFYAVPAFVVM